MSPNNQAVTVGLPFVNESATIVSQLLAVIDDRILDRTIKTEALTEHEQELLKRGHRFLSYTDSITSDD